MGCIFSGEPKNVTPKSLMLKIRDIYNIHNFIETGTYLGDTTKFACLNFEKVFSCEICKRYYDKSKKDLSEFENLYLFYGMSIDFLSSICCRLDSPSLFYLDDHIYKPKNGVNKNYLIKELDICLNLNYAHFIIIDDIRKILYPYGMGKDVEWPSIIDIVNCINKSKHKYFILGRFDFFLILPYECRCFMGEDIDYYKFDDWI